MTAIDEPRSLSGFEPTHDPRAEVGRTLEDPVPQTLGLTDQFGLWANLGVSLLGFTGALYVLQPGGTGTPELSLLAGLVAILLGTLLGTLAVAAAAVPGTRTGAPAMVLLRGLFGPRLSYVPTVLNITQCLGWGVFEIVTIATAAHRVAPGLPKWLAVLIAGALTVVLTVRPLGAVRVLRRYVGVALVVVLAYLFVQVLLHPLPPLEQGTWHGFWSATDTTVAVAVSFVPLAADYTRHARSERTAFAGVLVGYGVAQVLCYVLGLLCLLTLAKRSGDIYGAFIAVPLGQVAFGVLALRELDQSFANVYSTAASVQNLRPRLDRRLLAVAIGVLCTVGALFLSVGNDYQSFLLILGSVFVPMFAVLVVDFFVCSRGRWDLRPGGRSRWVMIVPWALGFVAYQMINPGTLSWWASLWGAFDGDVGFHPASWMSASVCSFLVAGALTLAAAGVQRAAGIGDGGRPVAQTEA
jgi:NCS1 family nucleobase:cation symporter-1